MSSAAKKAQSILLRPFHRANSDRLLEKSKDSPIKVYLDVPDQMQISNYSFIQDSNGVRRATRYYLGAQTIFLDEQLKSEKENQEPKRLLQIKDSVFITNGMIQVTDQHPNRILFKFLEAHNDNVSNPNRVIPENGEDYTAFQVIDYQKEASSELTDIEERELALSLLQKAKSSIGATRKFNDGELSKLKSIFGISTESNEESYMALHGIAFINPKEFVSKIEQVQYMIIADFEAAKSCGAVTWEKNKFYINEELVYTSSEKDLPKQDAEFIEFLSKPEGFKVYNSLRTSTEINTLKAK